MDKTRAQASSLGGQVEDVLLRVGRYLGATTNRYVPGQDEYYARLALEQAAVALREGNYGIGAVAVLVQPSRVLEFRAPNRILTGLGVIDHAETLAVLAARCAGDATDEYPRKLNRFTSDLPEGLSVYGTVEPCPMCVCAMTNAGARRSISTVSDGKIITRGGYLVSDGSASAIGEKSKLQPVVWQSIQESLGLTFAELSTDDEELVALSAASFFGTRNEIDFRLATTRP